MNIGFITTEFNYDGKIYGGLANYLKLTTQILSNKGHSCVVYTLAKNNFEMIEDGVQIIGIKEKADLRLLLIDFASALIFHKALLLAAKSLHVKKRVKKDLRYNSLDIVQYCSSYGLGLFKLHNKPTVLRLNSIEKMQDIAEERKGFKFKQKAWIHLKATKRFRSIFAPSKNTIQQLKRLTGLEGKLIRSPYVNSSVDLDTPVYGKKYLLYVGSLNKLKGISILASILNQFLQENTAFSFVFVGPIYEIDGKPGDQVLTDAVAYKERVFFTGKVVKNKVLQILRRAYAVVIPSLYENFPNTGIEAICNQIPLVASIETQLGEVITHEENGYLYKATNELELLDCLNSITGLSNDQYQGLKRKLCKLENLFSEEVYYKSIMRCYIETIDQFT